MKHEAKFIASVFDPACFPKEHLPEIALLGRSNVGKSSLINALLGVKGLARTSSQPGKTASINFYTLGNSLCFVDLPGFGFAKVPKTVRENWGVLIEAYFSKRKLPKLCLLVVDARRKLEEEEYHFLKWLYKKRIPVFIVFTKSDKLNKKEQKTILLFAQELAFKYETQVFLFSKDDKSNKDSLLKEIIKVIHETTE